MVIACAVTLILIPCLSLILARSRCVLLIRAQERGHRKARAKAGVGEPSLKRPFQFKKTAEVLDCGAAKRLAGAEPAAMLVQACEERDRTAANDPKFEVVEEKYHFRGIGEQVITSFIKL